MSREIQLPLATLKDQADDAAERIVSLLALNFTEISSTEECKNKESIFKTRYRTYENYSNLLFLK